jgi:hypothetical protein
MKLETDLIRSICLFFWDLLMAIHLIIKSYFFFLNIVYVSDTRSTTLKNDLVFVLSHHNLQIKNVCSHGYDSASDVRAWWMEWVYKHHFLMTSTVMQIMCIVLRSSCSITRCHLCSWFLFIFGFYGDIVRASCRWYDDWKMLKKLKLLRWLLLISWKQAKMHTILGFYEELEILV